MQWRGRIHPVTIFSIFNYQYCHKYVVCFMPCCLKAVSCAAGPDPACPCLPADHIFDSEALALCCHSHRRPRLAQESRSTGLSPRTSLWTGSSSLPGRLCSGESGATLGVLLQQQNALLVALHLALQSRADLHLPASPVVSSR